MTAVNSVQLTASLEDYLKTIYYLHKIDEVIHLSEIALKMAVSKPSAFKAVTLLTSHELVYYTKFAPIRMTSQGIKVASKLVARYETIKDFLICFLNIDEKLASAEACAIEHNLCDTTLARMADLLC